MLDNLGFGEIAMLALMALLFFGPERLPQIGARVGRWIATLTQSSKAFMNEWRDEALVVYDAVEEVKGIRDEILAARAEIAGTMTTARDDVNDALSGARADVQAQVRGATTLSPTPEQFGERTIRYAPDGAKQGHQPTSPPTGENPDRAIERTNEILANLRQKRGETGPTAAASESPATTTFSDANPLNLSAQHLWQQTAPRARDPIRNKTQPTALASLPGGGGLRGGRDSILSASERYPTLSSLRETVTALESDVQALREELARTRATLEAKTLPPGSEANPHADLASSTLDAGVPHPQPVHTGEQAGDPL